MKKLIGVGGVVILGIVAALLTPSAGAAPGDAVYVGLPLARTALSASERTNLRSAVVNTWSGVVGVNVDAVIIIKEKKQNPDGSEVLVNTATIEETIAPTDAEFLQLALSGQISPNKVDESLLNKKRPAVVLTASQEALFSAVTQSALGKPLDELFYVKFHRDTKGQLSRIVVDAHPIYSATPAQFRVRWSAGEIQRLIGVIE